MAAWGYEFYLLVLKVSLTSERSERVRDAFSTRRKKFVSPRGHVISSISRDAQNVCAITIIGTVLRLLARMIQWKKRLVYQHYQKNIKMTLKLKTSPPKSHNLWFEIQITAFILRRAFAPVHAKPENISHIRF